MGVQGSEKKSTRKYIQPDNPSILLAYSCSGTKVEPKKVIVGP